MKNQTFGKDEKLKSKKLIEKLFRSGDSLFVYPIKLVYIPINKDAQISKHQFGVTVSKKKFKKAVHRNRIKRLIREAYRINKSDNHDMPPVAMMAIYVADEELPFERIASSIKKILKLLQKSINNA